MDAAVGAEPADDAGHVGLERIVPRAVGEDPRAGALHPSRVVQARLRRALLAQLRGRVPHGVEQDEDHADPVPVGDREEPVHPRQEPRRVLLPEQVVEEDPDAVEPQPLGPAQLAVDRRRVEGVRLPHLELVDRRAGDVVAADQPGMLPRHAAARSGGQGPGSCECAGPGMADVAIKVEQGEIEMSLHGVGPSGLGPSFALSADRALSENRALISASDLVGPRLALSLDSSR